MVREYQTKTLVEVEKGLASHTPEELTAELGALWSTSGSFGIVQGGKSGLSTISRGAGGYGSDAALVELWARLLTSADAEVLLQDHKQVGGQVL